MKLSLGTTGRIAAVFALLAAVSQGVGLMGSRDLLATIVHEREIDKVKTLSNLIRSEVPELGTQTQLLAKLLHAQGKLATSLQAQDPQRTAALAETLADAHRISKVEVLTVTDSEGVVVYRAHDPSHRGDVETAWGVAEALAGHSMLVSSRSSLGVTIEAIEPIEARGRVVGSVIVGSRLDAEYLGFLSRALDADLALVSRTGQLVASSSPKFSMVNLEAVTDAFRTKIPVYRKDEAARTMTVYLPMLIVDEAWVVVAQVDSNPAYRQLDSASRDSALRAAAIAIASVALAIVILQFALKPLRRLRARAERTLRELTGEHRTAIQGDDIESVVRVLDTLTGRLMKHNQELADAKTKADAASEAKSQFLANMSHEIRTPLNGVLGMAELLQTTRLDPIQAHYCQTIATSGRMLHELLRDILDLAKIEARGVKLEQIPFDIVELVNDTAASFRMLASSRGVELILELDPAVPARVQGDPTRLRQVLANLLGNAVKFTANGRVTFTVARVDRGAADADVKLRFTVSDTGIGIAPEKLAGLFQPFVQADSSTTRTHGGSGLGLVISKHLAELMGGSIDVESELGRGTTFWCDIPYAIAPAASQDVAATSDATVFSGRVLVAEDNPVNREVVGALLGRLGVSVTLVDDGQQAVDAVGQRDFDLVFMDCQMPVLDGYAAVTKMRMLEQSASQARHVPVVALTAVASESDRRACFAAGMDDYISKPCSLQDLRGALARWLRAAPSSPDQHAPPQPGAGDDAATETAVAAPAINARTLDALQAMLPQKGASVVRNVIAAYLDDAPKRLRAMREAVAAADAEALRKAAHALKSGSRNVGADTLGKMAENIEKLGSAGGVPAAAEVLRAADAHYVLVERELSRRQESPNEHANA